MPGGCVFTRSQDPEEFDVSIDGRRNGDLFELNFGTALATYTITTQCQGHSGTSSGPGMTRSWGQRHRAHGFGPAPEEGRPRCRPRMPAPRCTARPAAISDDRHDPDHLQARLHLPRAAD
jgi:hypothetical protein